MFPTGIAFMAGIVRRGVGPALAPPPAIQAGRPVPPYVAAAEPQAVRAGE